MKYLYLLLLYSVLSVASPTTPNDLDEQNNKERIKRLVKLELQMNVDKIKKILNTNNIEFKHVNNSITIEINGYNLVIIYDVNADRMRIVCPIINTEDLKEGQLQQAMEANFHTALDAKYAMSDGIVWSVFVHPLSDLSEKLFVSALEQTLVAAATFGKEYTSGALVFPKNDEDVE